MLFYYEDKPIEAEDEDEFHLIMNELKETDVFTDMLRIELGLVKFKDGLVDYE